MNITGIIIVIAVLLIAALFPMLCAIIMKLLCKTFSDNFIEKFLTIVCPLPLILNSIFREIHEEDDPIGFRIASVLFAILLYSWICNLLAKMGITIMNKKNPNQSTHSITASGGSE